jgi:hypothetical protein
MIGGLDSPLERGAERAACVERSDTMTVGSPRDGRKVLSRV